MSGYRIINEGEDEGKNTSSSSSPTPPLPAGEDNDTAKLLSFLSKVKKKKKRKKELHVNPAQQSNFYFSYTSAQYDMIQLLYFSSLHMLRNLDNYLSLESCLCVRLCACVCAGACMHAVPLDLALTGDLGSRGFRRGAGEFVAEAVCRPSCSRGPATAAEIGQSRDLISASHVSQPLAPSFMPWN